MTEYSLSHFYGCLACDCLGCVYAMNGRCKPGSEPMPEKMALELGLIGRDHYETRRQIEINRLRAKVAELERRESLSRCANCGKSEHASEMRISSYDGEWFCSIECEAQHDELGCPFEHGTYYRHPIETRELLSLRAENARLNTALGQKALQHTKCRISELVHGD